MLANGYACTDPEGHNYKPVGNGVQQCGNCLQKQYYDDVTKTWRHVK